MVATLVVGAAVAEMIHWLQKITMKRSKGPDLLPHPADHARLTKTISEVKTLLSDIEMGPHIGAGTFGQVYKGQSSISRVFLCPVTEPDLMPVAVLRCTWCPTGVHNWETLDKNTTNPGNICTTSFYTSIVDLVGFPLSSKCHNSEQSLNWPRTMERDQRGSQSDWTSGGWLQEQFTDIT